MISEYNTFKEDNYNFIKCKIVLKGPFVGKKQLLKVEPVFAASWKIFGFLGLKTNDTTERKEISPRTTGK